MNMAGIEKQGAPDHKFQFNQGTGEKTFKTERQQDFSLNWDLTMHRAYDYQLVRFHQVDPLADQGGQESLTSYQYGWNNPVRYNDPWGEMPCETGDCPEKEESQKKEDTDAYSTAVATLRDMNLMDMLLRWLEGKEGTEEQKASENKKEKEWTRIVFWTDDKTSTPGIWAPTKQTDSQENIQHITDPAGGVNGWVADGKKFLDIYVKFRNLIWYEGNDRLGERLNVHGDPRYRYSHFNEKLNVNVYFDVSVDADRRYVHSTENKQEIVRLPSSYQPPNK